jgi:hypothetical protein
VTKEILKKINDEIEQKLNREPKDLSIIIVGFL